MGFEPTDVWVLVAVLHMQRPVSHEEIVRACDYLNRTIPTADELNGGLQRLAAAGYVTEGPVGVELGPKGSAFAGRMKRAKRGRWEIAAAELGLHSGPV